MINLEFTTDETKSCKHCYYFNQEGKYCEVQESHTGSNSHPPIPNPEAWACELYVEPYVEPNNTNTYEEESNKSPCNDCKYCTGACCYVDSMLIYDRDSCPYEETGFTAIPIKWAIKNIRDVIIMIENHEPFTMNDIYRVLSNCSFKIKPEKK